MRRARDVQVFENENGNPNVFLLQGNFCAEHEWGIRGINRKFGVKDDEKVFGIERRRITQIPEVRENAYMPDRFFYRRWTAEVVPPRKRKAQKIERSMIFFGSCHDFDPATATDAEVEKYVQGTEARAYDFFMSDKETWGAWSEGGFAIVTKTEHDALKSLYDAFMNKGVAIWTGKFGNNPFDPGGLVLAIIDNVDVEHKEHMRDNDKDQYELQKAARATGIYDLIQKTNGGNLDGPCGYFALRPMWLPTEGNLSKPTAHPVIFFLNPRHQRSNNFGWFTVEELEAWTRGEGPVVAEKKTA
jgi:hypothetical protein